VIPATEATRFLRRPAPHPGTAIGYTAEALHRGGIPTGEDNFSRCPYGHRCGCGQRATATPTPIETTTSNVTVSPIKTRRMAAS